MARFIFAFPDSFAPERSDPLTFRASTTRAYRPS